MSGIAKWVIGLFFPKREIINRDIISPRITPAKPVNFEKMIEISRKLSAGIPFLRVDMYEINGKVFVGEMTFYSWAGFEPFHPEEWDDTLGSWLKLPDKKRR